jgi:hypothetical protein
VPNIKIHYYNVIGTSNRRFDPGIGQSGWPGQNSLCVTDKGSSIHTRSILESWQIGKYNIMIFYLNQYNLSVIQYTISRGHKKGKEKKKGFILINLLYWGMSRKKNN